MKAHNSSNFISFKLVTAHIDHFKKFLFLVVMAILNAERDFSVQLTLVVSKSKGDNCLCSNKPSVRVIRTNEANS